MTRLRRFVDSYFFQNFVLAVIVLAAIFTGLETSRDLVADYGAILHTIVVVCFLPVGHVDELPCFVQAGDLHAE